MNTGMLRGPSLLLVCVLAGALAAQSPHVVVAPGVSHTWFSVIYQGSIYFQVPIFQSPFQSAWYPNGKVVIDGTTLATARVVVHPGAWPVALYGSGAVGHTELRASGSSASGSFQYHTPAHVVALAVGVTAARSLGGAGPRVEATTGFTSLRITSTPLAGGMGVPLQDFTSPGVETSVALAYPARSSRFAIEARGMFSAVHHHTAGLDGGFSPPGPSSNWAGNLGIGVGAQVAF